MIHRIVGNSMIIFNDFIENMNIKGINSQKFMGIYFVHYKRI